jgi:cysteine-rich repeat protein
MGTRGVAAIIGSALVLGACSRGASELEHSAITFGPGTATPNDATDGLDTGTPVDTSSSTDTGLDDTDDTGETPMADSTGDAPPGDPVCGDGVLDDGEACDDGPANGPAGDCTATCTLPACGDGIVHPSEACDDGNADDTGACRSDCTVATTPPPLVHQRVDLSDDGNTFDCPAST